MILGEQLLSSIPMRFRYKLHPQLSSLAKARKAISKVDVRGKRVLDPFCGTGTLLIAVAEVGGTPIGSDVEDWSRMLRPGAERFEYHWGISAERAVKVIDHEVLFTDPPNPMFLVGGRLASAYRDTGVSGAMLKRMLRLSRSNVMGRLGALKLVEKVVRYEVSQGRFAILNLFGPYKKFFVRRFELEQLYNTYYLVKRIKT